MGCGLCKLPCIKKAADVQIFSSSKKNNQNSEKNIKKGNIDKDSSIININNKQNINLNNFLVSVKNEQKNLENLKRDKEEENEQYINQNINQKNNQNKISENKIMSLETYKNKLEKEIEKLEEDITNKQTELENINDTIQKNKMGLNENEKLIKMKKELENQYNLLKEKENNFEKEKNQINIKIVELQKKEKEIILRENNVIKKEINLNEREKKIIEIEKKNKIVLIGLNNIGATCYMNATLECLSNTKELTEYFLTNYKKAPNKKMANEYYEVLKNLWNVDSDALSYSPYSFKEVLSKENPLFICWNCC